MIARYKQNDSDTPIVEDIIQTIKGYLDQWYGQEARLMSEIPEIRSYRNSFMLRFHVSIPGSRQKTLLVKIRRNPKMESLHQAIASDIHQNIPSEYRSLTEVYERMADNRHHFDAIRPLLYLEKYQAILMEEYPSRTLRHILGDHRWRKDGRLLDTIKDAARKTGRWLYYFQHHIHTPTERPYSTGDILEQVKEYGDRLEYSSRGRVQARALVEAFSRKLEHVHIERMTFSLSHADMTCDNVLYSDDKRVCVIDIKTHSAPVYADLGLLLIHPETAKPQIFSGGAYYPESLLREYREEILAGYFEEEPGDDLLVRIFSAIKVMDKWLMYEELMNRYKGVKRFLSFPVGPFVTAYFQNLLQKHLASIQAPDSGGRLRVANTADRSA